jgi:hypothetical protein
MGSRSKHSVVPPRPALAASADRLAAILVSAEAFAAEHDLSTWADWFRDASQLGQTSDAQAPYHPDMLPAAGFEPFARQLLAMATRAWVFGGMGSWNDLGYADLDNESYSTITRELYAAVLGAFVAVVNTGLNV